MRGRVVSGLIRPTPDEAGSHEVLMRKRPMPHQRDVVKHAGIVRHPAIFHEMRLGKTLPTIRKCRMYVPRGSCLRVLVVAPNSALGSWERELVGDGVNANKIVYLQGNHNTRLQALAFGLIEAVSWFLINKEGWQALPQIADIPWDAVVLDESTFIKNPKAKITRFFLKNFRDVPHRWALTGTPNPEGPLDLWCQIAWLDGRAFKCKSYWQFRARYFEPGQFGFGWEPKQGAEREIEHMLGRRAHCLGRKDAGMRIKKVREVRRLDMPKKLRDAYVKAEKEFVLEYNDKEIDKTVWATARWHWMRRMCGGFVDGKLVWPGKVNELASLAAGELAHEQIAVWFAYNLEIDAAWDAIHATGAKTLVMNGRTPVAERRVQQRKFASGDCRILLLQESLVETGLDLSAADTAIYFSNHPALQKRLQSEARIEHPKKKTSLLYIDMAVRDTVDEDVTDLIIEKRWKSQALFNAAVVERAKMRRAL